VCAETLAPHSQASNTQQYYKLNAAFINNPSLSLSWLDTWIKATEKGLTYENRDCVRSAETTGTGKYTHTPPIPYN